MDSRAHARAKELFLAACELPREARGAFLDRQCSGDGRLRREIESLLECHEAEPPETPHSQAPTLDADQSLPPSKPSIGNYRFVERLGEGGMGEVYEAEQVRPMRRRVALKLIKWGMDTREVVARFESERQALALMDHPNIARVLDGGATDQGRPYFVMEFVKGVPIHEYCDSLRLSTRERLQLFLQVCDGVQHAHQRGIIHRDIKPSNVLVAVQGDAAVPKIIDFGIAKAIDQRLTEDTVHTELGQIIGTPAYMSPEQAELSRLDIDTRTDVYSLGVLLYELLVGALPFEATDPSVGLDEMRRRIREDEPARPSSRVTTGGNASRESAERRSTDAGSLARLLRGDLDWIVMKALEKDRTRRYSAPSELAADVERHLTDEPVLAAAPSSAYRVRKFVRRNRLAVGVVAGIIAALTLGVAGLAIGLIEAVRARSVAQQESRTATEVADFLVGLFEVSDPGEARGNTVTAREILDRGASRIETELADQPGVQARMMATMGSVYRGLGLYDRAVELLERALALREENLGPADHERVENLFDLGWVMYLQGDEQRGRAVADRCLELGERIYDNDDPRWAKVLAGVAALDRRDGRTLEAEQKLKRAIAIWDGAPDHGEPFYGYALDEMAYLLEDRGDLDAAFEFAERSLRFREQVLGPDHPGVAASLDAMGTVLEERGDLEGAREIYERVLALEERTLGPNHPELPDTLIELGELRHRLGEREGAIPLYERALAILEDTFGITSPIYVDALYRLGATFHKTGERDLARSYYDRALGILGTQPEHWYLNESNLFGDYGNLLLQAGDTTGAREYYERGLASAEARGGLADPFVALNAGYLGNLFERNRNWDEALRYYLLHLRSRELQGTADDSRLAWAHNAVGHAQTQMGRLEQARVHLERALAILEGTRGPDHVDTAWILNNLGDVAVRQGRIEEARVMFERALEINEAAFGPDHPRVAWNLLGLAAVEWKTGNYEATRPLHARALAILERELGAGNGEVARFTYNLACIDARLGDRDRAIESLHKALDRGFSWTGINTDEDLDSLRGDPEFEAIVAEVNRRNPS